MIKWSIYQKAVTSKINIYILYQICQKNEANVKGKEDRNSGTGIV